MNIWIMLHNLKSSEFPQVVQFIVTVYKKQCHELDAVYRKCGPYNEVIKLLLSFLATIHVTIFKIVPFEFLDNNLDNMNLS